VSEPIVATPTTPRVARAIEQLRAALIDTYGDEYVLSVGAGDPNRENLVTLAIGGILGEVQAKANAIELVGMDESDTILCLGHVHPKDFAEAIDSEYSDLPEVDEIHHGYCRIEERANPDSSLPGDTDHWYVKADRNTPGAVPITYYRW
jgi:hypothetical protein